MMNKTLTRYILCAFVILSICMTNVYAITVPEHKIPSNPKIGKYLKAQIDQGMENIPVIIILKSETTQNPKSQYKMIASRLRAQNKESQSNVSDLVRMNGGTVIRNFWIINGILATIPANKIEVIAYHPSVEKIYYDKPNRMSLVNSTVQIGSRALNFAGYDGTGVTIAIADTGIDINMSGTGIPHSAFKINGSKDNPSRIVHSKDLVINDSDGDNPDDFMGHGTLVAGIAAGANWAPDYMVFDPSFNTTFKVFDLSGVAPNASIINEKIFNSDTFEAPDSAIIAGIEDASENGADIISLSIEPFNLSDETDPVQRAYDSAIYNMDIVVVASSSNYGPKERTATNIAPNAIIVGGVGQMDNVAYYSGRGPTLEGRIKPDIVAPGGDLSPPDYKGLDPGNFDFSNDTNYWKKHIYDAPDGLIEDYIYGPFLDHEEICIGSVGTSFAAPHVSGTAALVLQANKSLSALEVKAILLNSADDISLLNPNLTEYDYGYGRLNATEAINTALTPKRVLMAKDVLKKTGESAYYSFHSNASETIEITLAWNRHETGGDFIQLNNLDLKLYDPNNLEIAKSTSPVDNVERITINAPVNGNYTLEVIGTSITDSPESFALASTHPLNPKIVGDLDHNGKVDLEDATMVAYMVIGKIPSNPDADFNHNGRVDIGDAAKIAFYNAGKISSL